MRSMITTRSNIPRGNTDFKVNSSTDINVSNMIQKKLNDSNPSYASNITYTSRWKRRVYIYTNRISQTPQNMENNDAEIIEIIDSPCKKRRLRRRSSLYGSPLTKSEIVPNNEKLQYVAQLQNEKIQWIRLQEEVLANSLKVEPPIKCEPKHLNSQLTGFCDERPDMQKFVTDAKAFIEKFHFYTKLEIYYAQKLKYAEQRLKDRVDEVTAKLFVDEIEDKVYL